MKLDPAKVRQARERLGLSLDDVAKAADVSQNSAIRAEHGEEIRPVTARRIARGLGLEVADLYPKSEAPTSSPESEAWEERRTTAVLDLPQEEFLRTLSEASEAGDDVLIDLYHRLDAERATAELVFRADESDPILRSTYARAVERRMMVFLSLVERNVSPPDPEQLSLQAEQLEQLQLPR